MLGDISIAKDIYIIVETAKTNNIDWDHTDEFMEDMMPWSEFMQEVCRVDSND